MWLRILNTTRSWPTPSDVFSIELITNSRSSPRIVKIGDSDRLQDELDAWESVRDRLTSPDPLFVSLNSPQSDSGAREVLEYDHANRVLSASEVVELEEVVRRCCRYGSPTLATVSRRIRRIFKHLLRNLYQSAEVAAPDKVESHYRERLAEAIPTWQRPENIRLRRAILFRLDGSPDKFQDPVDWVDWLLSPEGLKCLPACLFGPCHGDLHGRNILIGLDGGEAMEQAIYDYEDMSLHGPIARDLVKLEMELKVHILPEVIQSLNEGRDYVDLAVEFERSLYQGMIELDHEAIQPVTRPDERYSKDWQRLFDILLAIRRCARECLSGRERSVCWKEEYLFTMVAYAVGTAKYKAYEDPHRRLVYIAGGIAAAHFASDAVFCPLPIPCDRQKCRKPQQWPSKRRMKTPNTGAFGQEGRFVFPGYWSALDQPQKLAQSRVASQVQKATEQPKQLCTLYPHVIAIEQELALAYIELSALTKGEDDIHRIRTKAEKILTDLISEFSTADEETLGKLGRLHKECAWRINGYGTMSSEDDKVHYRRALHYYQKAYSFNNGYYPGINVATLHLLLGDENEAKRIARAIMDGCNGFKPEILQDATERIWVEFTRGEAHLILGQYEAASECYRTAMSCDPTEAYAESPARHARCILAKRPPEDPAMQTRVFRALGIAEMPPPKRRDEKRT